MLNQKTMASGKLLTKEEFTKRFPGVQWRAIRELCQEHGIGGNFRGKWLFEESDVKKLKRAMTPCPSNSKDGQDLQTGTSTELSLPVRLHARSSRQIPVRPAPIRSRKNRRQKARFDAFVGAFAYARGEPGIRRFAWLAEMAWTARSHWVPRAKRHGAALHGTRGKRV
jgi:hypothetical protein